MFTQATFDFLFENRVTNDRWWYLENKPRYEAHVLAPLVELATALAPTISAVDELIVTEAKVDKTISRIYRDTRFCRDKSLYRDEMWLTFKRDKKEFPGYPEFFFVLSGKQYMYGCGYYATSSEVMEVLRSMILNDDPLFLAAQKAYKSQSDFVLEGDRYKKNRYPNEDPELHRWLNMKNISVMVKSEDYDLLYSDKLAEKIIAAFEKMEPIYNFFLHAERKARGLIG